jgi:CRP-like cAMP-binding protein
MEKTIESRLALIPLFAGLSPDQLAPLSSATRAVSLKEGELLCKQGEPGDTMYLIDEGRLKVYIQGTDNKEVVLDILGPDDVIGELALLDGQPRSAYAQALSDCELLALDRAPFLQHLRQYPATAIHLLTYLSMRLRQTVLQAESLAVNDSVGRLAHVILFLAERDGEIEPGVVTSALRKKDLAAAIGCSEEWVTRMLQEWSRDGIIGMTGPRRLILHDVAALKALSHREDDQEPQPG